MGRLQSAHHAHSFVSIILWHRSENLVSLSSKASAFFSISDLPLCCSTMLRTPSSSEMEQEFCVPGSSIVPDFKRKADVMIAGLGMESNETKDSMCRLVAAAIDSELGTLTVDREDALLHGPFADINLARIVVDKDTGDVVIKICGSSRQMQCASRPMGILTFLSNSEERQRYTKNTHNQKNTFKMSAKWVPKSLRNLCLGGGFGVPDGILQTNKLTN